MKSNFTVRSSLYVIYIIYGSSTINTLLLLIYPPFQPIILAHNIIILRVVRVLNAKSFVELYKMRHTKRFVTDNLITFLMRNTLFSRAIVYMFSTIPESPVEDASNANNSFFFRFILCISIVQLLCYWYNCALKHPCCWTDIISCITKIASKTEFFRNLIYPYN